MASYPVIEPEPVDPFEVAAEHAITTLRAAMPHVALPPKRIALRDAADQLERELERRAT